MPEVTYHYGAHQELRTSDNPRADRRASRVTVTKFNPDGSVKERYRTRKTKGVLKPKEGVTQEELDAADELSRLEFDDRTLDRD